MHTPGRQAEREGREGREGSRQCTHLVGRPNTMDAGRRRVRDLVSADGLLRMSCVAL